EIASDAALYFKPGNKEELCNCISRLINNVDERKKMVQRGIERVKLFTWEKHIKILEQILSSVLKTNETTLPESKNR
ncbi:MAG TPA: hypothetical protein VKO63_07195, partial [Chitinispirillaceae bacterium]|nr:hypothetical protein [Chitinispirillaceae bacterium]